jgi:xylulokinase
MGYLLGVDIGTQGIKGVLLDENLKIVKKAYVEHNYIQPKANWFEHDAEETWWKGFKTIIQKLFTQISFSPQEIIGIGCSGVSPCMLPVDNRNKPLRNAILYGIDTRAQNEIREITQKLGENKLLEINKQPLTTQSVGPKILWYKKNEPEKFKKTKRIFTSTNYIVSKLTGNYVLDHSQAAFFGPFYDFKKHCWNKEICELFNIPLNLFPELKNVKDIAGKVSQKVAEETGLSKGIPVITGTADGIAEIISAGSSKPGEVTLVYGTTGIISMITNKIPSTKELWILPHFLFPGKYLVVGGTATSAALTKWFRDNFGDVEKIMQKRIKINAYDLLIQQAEKITPGSQGLIILPYFSGERTPINDPLARGVIMGLTLSHSRAHIYRALLEGTAYSFQHHFDIFRQHKLEISKVIACGGGTKSVLWVQIVSDVIGYDQFVPNAIIGAEMGMAYLAAKAVGLFDDYSSVMKAAGGKDTRKRIEFNQKNHEMYREYYKIYRNLYKNIKNDMHTLASKSE